MPMGAQNCYHLPFPSGYGWARWAESQIVRDPLGEVSEGAAGKAISRGVGGDGGTHAQPHSPRIASRDSGG